MVELPEPLASETSVELLGPEGLALRGWLQPASESERSRFLGVLPDADPARLHRFEIQEAALLDGSTASAEEWTLDTPGWVDQEQFILDHMNDDHVSEMQLMCAQLRGVEVAEPRMVAVDPEGMHLRAGDALLYFRFEEVCDTVREVAGQTIVLTHRARAMAGGEAEPADGRAS